MHYGAHSHFYTADVCLTWVLLTSTKYFHKEYFSITRNANYSYNFLVHLFSMKLNLTRSKSKIQLFINSSFSYYYIQYIQLLHSLTEINNELIFKNLLKTTACITQFHCWAYAGQSNS